jgi:hypothetical protein
MITRKLFDPLSLNPIIAYEMQESMMAPLASESLDLDPANPSSLDIITATRAGTATYTDASGNIQTASANTVRVDHVDGVPMILVEPAATNLIENSEDFSQDVTLSNCTVQSGFTAPDASSNAYKLIEDNTNSLKLFRAHNDTITTASTSYSASIFVKAGERTKVRIYGYHLTNQFFAVDYDLTDNSVLGPVEFNTQVDGYSIEDCGNGWKRITVTGQKASTYSWDVGVSPLDDSGNVTYTGDGTSGVYIWGAQLEQGTVATSYIPTSGSTVTRAADNLVIDGSDFTNFYNTSEGTFYVEFTPKDITVGEQYLLRGGDSNRRIIYSNGNLSNIRSYDGANILTMSNNVESNALHRIAVSFDSTTMKGSFNGETEVTATHNGNLLTSSLLQIGSNYIGHIKRLIYWPHHSDNL